MSMKENHVFRNTNSEIENVCSELGCKKKQREGGVEGGELPQIISPVVSNNISYLSSDYVP